MTQEELYKPLEFKEIEAPDYVKRILFFDPSELYSKLTIDPLLRYNPIGFLDIFPDRNDGFCDCGCGKVLKKSKKKWATTDCLKFATGVWNVLTGQTPYIGWLLGYYMPNTCFKCGNFPCEADHIIPVNKGGG